MTTICLSHKENEKCAFKKYIKILSKYKYKTSSNEELINEVH
jgi:hypothetical protein